MAVYVDALRAWPQPAANAHAANYFGDGRESCHMTADTLTELVTFMMTRLGFPASYLQREGLPEHLYHVDLNPNMRKVAVRRGAVEFDILSEAYPLQVEDRSLCLGVSQATIFDKAMPCAYMAIRQCALCGDPICHRHSYPGDPGAERLEFLCFHCAIK